LRGSEDGVEVASPQHPGAEHHQSGTDRRLGAIRVERRRAWRQAEQLEHVDVIVRALLVRSGSESSGETMEDPGTVRGHDRRHLVERHGVDVGEVAGDRAREVRAVGHEAPTCPVEDEAVGAAVRGLDDQHGAVVDQVALRRPRHLVTVRPSDQLVAQE
jgi:hypothetical protein